MSVWSSQPAISSQSSRFPRTAREHEILRVSGELTNTESNLTSIARTEILKWAQNRSGGELPKEASRFENFEYLFGGRNCMAARINHNGADIWALRAEDPDKFIAGRTWTTEAVVGCLNGGRPQFSVRLIANTTESNLDIAAHVPGLVQQITDQCGLSINGFSFSEKNIFIQDEFKTHTLISLLEDQERQLPVYAISLLDDGKTTAIDAFSLYKATIGIAHVVVLSPNCSWTLTEQLGGSHSVYEGAIRCYMPGFQRGCSQYDHRLIFADYIKTGFHREMLSKWMRNLAASESLKRMQLGKNVLTFASVRSSALAYQTEIALENGYSDNERLILARKQIDSIRDQYNEALSLQDYFAEEHKAMQERAIAAEQQSRAAAYQIQILRTKIERSEKLDNDLDALPASWSSFAAWCDDKLAG